MSGASTEGVQDDIKKGTQDRPQVPPPTPTRRRRGGPLQADLEATHARDRTRARSTTRGSCRRGQPFGGPGVVRPARTSAGSRLLSGTSTRPAGAAARAAAAAGAGDWRRPSAAFARRRGAQVPVRRHACGVKELPRHGRETGTADVVPAATAAASSPRAGRLDPRPGTRCAARARHRASPPTPPATPARAA